MLARRRSLALAVVYAITSSGGDAWNKVAVVASVMTSLVAACGDDAAAVPDAGERDAGTDASTKSPCAGKEDVIEGFRIGMEAAGEDMRITGKLVDAVPVSPQKYLNDWTLDFLDGAGEPVADVEITKARSFMPVHGHDGTFEPVITKQPEPGRFEVARLNLWMRGPWLIQMDVDSPTQGTDYIEFEVCIEE